MDPAFLRVGIMLLAALVFALAGGFCFWRELQLETKLVADALLNRPADALAAKAKADLMRFVGWLLLVLAAASLFLLFLPT